MQLEAQHLVQKVVLAEGGGGGGGAATTPRQLEVCQAFVDQVQQVLLLGAVQTPVVVVVVVECVCLCAIVIFVVVGVGHGVVDRSFLCEHRYVQYLHMTSIMLAQDCVCVESY